MDFPDLVGEPGVKEDSFGRGGLTCIDVRNDTNISVSLDWRRSRHFGNPVGYLVLAGT
jgi:hypothetical protein